MALLLIDPTLGAMITDTIKKDNPDRGFRIVLLAFPDDESETGIVSNFCCIQHVMEALLSTVLLSPDFVQGGPPLGTGVH